MTLGQKQRNSEFFNANLLQHNLTNMTGSHKAASLSRPEFDRLLEMSHGVYDEARVGLEVK